MDHDRLFKELLTTFFGEFVELFFPAMFEYFDPESIEFLDKEIYTDVTGGQKHEVDVIAKARFRDRDSFFLVHVETQAQARSDFARRMFTYFARLHEKFALPVYPVAVFSYDQPQRAEPDQYLVHFPDLEVLAFRFRVVQLNQLDWHEFVERTNPIAAALMSRMYSQPRDRPRLKAACLGLLGKLQLDPARRELISGFIDAYLRLTMDEEQQFETELNKLEPRQREQIMEIVTSWMEKGMEEGMEKGMQMGMEKGMHEGMEKGIEQGVKQGKRDMIVRQLRKRLGAIESDVQARVEDLSAEQFDQLAEAVLEIDSSAGLVTWLDANAAH